MLIISDEINEWVSKAGAATHVIIMRDKEEGDYYPVYIMPDENLESRLKYLRLSANMQEVKDVIKI